MPPLFVYIVSKVKVVENYDRLTPRSQLVSFIIFRAMKKKLAQQGLVVIVAKGQVISECLFDNLKFSKKPTKNLTNFCHTI